MENKLNGLNIAILATNGFEQSELLEPKKALEEAGAKVTIVSLQAGEIKGWKDKNWTDSVAVDMTLDDAKAENFDALQLPGGVVNPDLLRVDKRAVDFVKSFVDASKPVAAICHAPWILVEADVVRGKTVTSYKSVRTDLINAGAIWVDEEVVVDSGLITSRKPTDLPAFNEKMIEEFAKINQQIQKKTAQ